MFKSDILTWKLIGKKHAVFTAAYTLFAGGFESKLPREIQIKLVSAVEDQIAQI